MLYGIIENINIEIFSILFVNMSTEELQQVCPLSKKLTVEDVVQAWEAAQLKSKEYVDVIENGNMLQGLRNSIFPFGFGFNEEIIGPQAGIEARQQLIATIQSAQQMTRCFVIDITYAIDRINENNLAARIELFVRKVGGALQEVVKCVGFVSCKNTLPSWWCVINVGIAIQKMVRVLREKQAQDVLRFMMENGYTNNVGYTAKETLLLQA
jgi:hypothetical protein